MKCPHRKVVTPEADKLRREVPRRNSLGICILHSIQYSTLEIPCSLPRPTKVSEGGFLVCICIGIPFEIRHWTFDIRYSISFLSPPAPLIPKGPHALVKVCPHQCSGPELFGRDPSSRAVVCVLASASEGSHFRKRKHRIEYCTQLSFRGFPT